VSVPAVKPKETIALLAIVILTIAPEDVPADHEKWRDVPHKLKYLSEKPGRGD